ncbi:unnamed protein product [Taenia asiatica]|uniref:Transposase n=1 Tax=Taenia asiatica TaxID=60517 RepID=A0A0R3WHI6_TAEAS|nr:unnamed protein product [Taenia asiatica]
MIRRCSYGLETDGEARKLWGNRCQLGRVVVWTGNERRAGAFSCAEDGMVTDLLLAQHLAHLGIEVQRQRKTDRTVMEMEVEVEASE